MENATPPPLEILHESAEATLGDQPHHRELAPGALTHFYGGGLNLPDSGTPPIIANFVATIDGVTTFDRATPRGAAAVGGGSPSDRLLMAILRAAADVILVGAGTLRVTGNHLWTAEALAPECAPALTEARRRFTGDARPPGLVVVTATGEVSLDHPAFAAAQGRAVVITTAAGAARLAPQAGPAQVVVGAQGGELEPARIIEIISERLTPRLILTEGGPLLLGGLLSAGLVDELFLSVSPILAGRSAAWSRPGIIDGFAAGPEDAPGAALLSLRRAADGLLCFRYRIGGFN